MPTIDDIESSDPFMQEESLVTSTAKWVTLLELNNDPDKKLYVMGLYVLLDTTAGTPEAYVTIIVDGVPKVQNFASYEGGLAYYFWGRLVFVGKKSKPAIVIKVKSNGTGTLTAEASVHGILTPLPKQPK